MSDEGDLFTHGLYAARARFINGQGPWMDGTDEEVIAYVEGLLRERGKMEWLSIEIRRSIGRSLLPELPR